MLDVTLVESLLEIEVADDVLCDEGDDPLLDEGWEPAVDAADDTKDCVTL